LNGGRASGAERGPARDLGRSAHGIEGLEDDRAEGAHLRIKVQRILPYASGRQVVRIRRRLVAPARRYPEDGTRLVERGTAAIALTGRLAHVELAGGDIVALRIGIRTDVQDREAAPLLADRRDLGCRRDPPAHGRKDFPRGSQRPKAQGRNSSVRRRDSLVQADEGDVMVAEVRRRIVEDLRADRRRIAQCGRSVQPRIDL
jgi:hypothetical protein